MSDSALALAGDLSAAFVIESAPALNVKPDTDAAALARALFAAAYYPVPMALSTLDRWWDVASTAQRTRLVLRLARAWPLVDSQTTHRLNDPRWRSAVGLPLALAMFALDRRGKRRHRAANTLRAWNADWNQWRRWCKRLTYPSFNPSAKQLEAFFTVFAPAHKVATIRRFGATLTAMHKAAGFPDPLATPVSHEIWLAALKPPKPVEDHAVPKNGKGKKKDEAAHADNDDGDRRTLGVDKAAALRFETLKKIIAAIDAKTLLGARDEALLRVTYDMLGRRSEVVALRIKDVEASYDKPGAGKALIRRSKTDQAGKGRSMYLRPETWASIEHWKTLSGICDPDSYLFRSLPGFAAHKTAVALLALKPGEVSRIIKRRLQRAAIVDPVTNKPLFDAALFSGHSCRVGAAQDMALAGYTDTEIMHQGRWKSHAMLMRYIEEIRESQGAMAKLADSQTAAATADRAAEHS